MNNLQTAPAFCGSLEAVATVKVSDVQTSNEVTTFKAFTKGDNAKLIRMLCSSDETAAKQVQVLAANASAKGETTFRVQVFGAVEVDFLPSKLEGNPQKPLLLRVAVTQAKPVHPNPQMEPDQNSALLFGQVSQYKELEFAHLDTKLAEGKAPARVKLAGKTKGMVEELVGKDVVLVGRFGQQTNLEASEIDGKEIPPYDHLSFSASGVQVICLTPGSARMPAKAQSGGVITASYEYGDTGSKPVDNQKQLDEMADADF